MQCDKLQIWHWLIIDNADSIDIVCMMLSSNGKCSKKAEKII